MAQLQIFFLPTSSFPSPVSFKSASRLVSIEGDRRLEGSSAKHANVYLRSRRIYGGSYRVNYVVYVWTGRICWSVGVRYIYI